MSATAYWKIIGAGLVAVTIAVLSGLYAFERERRQSAELEVSQVSAQLNALIKLKEDQQAKIRLFNELSIKYAGDAANAKKEIDSLRADIRNGTKRVYIKASCPESMPGTDTSGSMGDARTAEVERATGQDILDLREMNTKATRQILYLQDYIKTQCHFLK